MRGVTDINVGSGKAHESLNESRGGVQLIQLPPRKGGSTTSNPKFRVQG
jgi:hypothetical protein